MAALFHIMINVTNLFSLAIINEPEFMAVNCLVWVVIALAMVLTRRSLFPVRRTP